MTILDNPKELEKYQASQVPQSIGMLPKQIKLAWEEALKQKIPTSYAKCDNIVFCGMGGSNLSSEMIRSLYGAEIKKPFVLVRDYDLPAFVGKNSLVVIGSYSGNTEESLSCFAQAVDRRASIFCLSGGGKLIALAKKHKIPYYVIDNGHNPSNQPRYGLGSQLGASLALMSKCKIIKISKQEVDLAVQYLDVLNKSLNLNRPASKNLAKQLAQDIKGHSIILIASEFLSANIHILANQLNESAKTFATYHLIPELNHHLMEGLELPDKVKNNSLVLLFNSSEYSAVIQKRHQVTQRVLKQQGIKHIEYYVSGKNRLMTALEVLLFGAWLSLYLAVLNRKDPVAIPWVDYFKKELIKNK